MDRKKTRKARKQPQTPRNVNNELKSATIVKSNVCYWCLAILVLLISVFAYLAQPPRIPLQSPLNQDNTNVYDLKDINSPELYGVPIFIMSRIILQTPILSDLVLRYLKKDNEMYKLNQFAYYLPSIPVYWPRKLLTDVQYEQHLTQHQSLSQDSKQILFDDDFRNQILPPPPQQHQALKLTTIESLYNGYKSGKFTPNDMVNQAIKGMEELKDLNIFEQINFTETKAQAQASTQRWKAGSALSVLDGIPIAVKPEFKVKGFNVTDGTNFLGQFTGTADRHGLIVQRLTDLGAIVLGMTNMVELGAHPLGMNAWTGTPRNPYSRNLTRIPGGSSSGSAVAVASGIVPIAVGSDGGGSIRVPAAMNGVVGLKPTWNRVPLEQEIACWSNVHAGIISRTVRDQIIAYEAIAGGVTAASLASLGDIPARVITSDDNKISNPPPHLFGVKQIDDLSDVTIGIFPDWFNHGDTNVVQQCQKIVDVLQEKYHVKVKNFTIPYLSLIQKAHALIILSEFVNAHMHYWDHGYRYQDDIFINLKLGQSYSSDDLIAAMKLRGWFLEQLDEIFADIDVIVTPATPKIAFKIPEFANTIGTGYSSLTKVSNIMRFMFFGNFGGNPGLVMPVGYDSQSDGELPISLQLMSAHWNEHIVFRVANVIEQNVKLQAPPKQNRFTYKI